MATTSTIAEALGLSPERVELNIKLHRAAAEGDLQSAKELLEQGADAWYEDENLGWSSLHFAAEAGNAKLCRLLLRKGAIWNAVDAQGVTAAEVAWSWNHEACYRAIFDEGVRQTILLNLLDRREGEATQNIEAADVDAEVQDGQGSLTLRPERKELTNDNKAFLKSKLNYVKDAEGKDRCLDEDGNMVMAAWETDIMRRSADVLCEGQEPGLSILNVGFGLGIIDKEFQRYSPASHTIIEAHPDALRYMREHGWADIPGLRILEGRWEDFAEDPELGVFDAVYFDTYSQDYADLRAFFEILPNILSGPSARFSFFHGLAATNSFLYDVYTRVSELDLREIGLSTRWSEVAPGLREETWQGVRRKYWDLDTYRLPVCVMDI